jgi:hypothetical protein
MMFDYYDRQGRPLTWKEWAASFETRGQQKRVAETTLPNGRWVSTVWLGLDLSFGEGRPLIFETMVFPSEHDMRDLDCDRYSTEAEAIAGHEAMCAKWSVESPETIDEES